MALTFLRCLWLLALAGVLLLPQPAMAEGTVPKIGMVIMHGKGGNPTRLVADLARYLAEHEALVANLQMPWSGKRKYDVNVADAVAEVQAALDDLRKKGAQKLFVAGHSQGGLFTFYFGGRHKVDGLIAIAPGGNVASPVFREKLHGSRERARALIAEGKGNDKTDFYDFESSKGFIDVTTTPVIYLDWFDPDGPMNQSTAVKAIIPGVPILYIVPVMDYPGLIKAQGPTQALMPKNPGNKLYEPDASHTGAPSASKEEILRWIREIAEK